MLELTGDEVCLALLVLNRDRVRYRGISMAFNDFLL